MSAINPHPGAAPRRVQDRTSPTEIVSWRTGRREILRVARAV
jgi:hypothetical protein